MLKSKNDIDFSKLKISYDWSYNNAMKPFRDFRREAIKNIVGSEYDSSATKIPINMLNTAIMTYVKRLCLRIPKVSVVSYNNQLKPSAYKLEMATNQLCDDIKLKDTIRKVILEALVSMGCVKIGLAQGENVEPGAAFLKTGQVFVESVDFDDLVIDMNAKSIEQIQYIGNKYLVEAEYVKNCDYFDEKIRYAISQRAYAKSDESADIVAEKSNGTRYKNMVRLIDLYLPCENMFITMDDESGNVLYAEEWAGMGCPYITLSFMPVLSNLMPLSMAQLLIGLHNANNVVWSKLINQAQRQKSLLLVSDDEEAIRKIKEAKDGDVVKMTNMNGAVMQNFGTIEQTTFALGERIMDKFSWLAGNLDTLGGLSQQAGTATQEGMLNQNASMSIQDMQNVLFDFMKKIYQQVVYFIWENPYIEIPYYLPIKGIDKVLYSVYNENEKEGEYFNYMFDLSPYSIDNNSPGSKLMAIKQILNEIIFPMLPLMQQQGLTIDYENTIKLIAKYADIKDIDEIVKFAIPSIDGNIRSEAAAPTQVKSNAPRHDTRQYVSSKTSSGSSQLMAQIMAGGKVQPNETNKI